MEVGKRTGYNVVDGIAWCTGEEASGRGKEPVGPATTILRYLTLP